MPESYRERSLSLRSAERKGADVREWIGSLLGKPFVLVAVAAVAILATAGILIVPVLVAGPTDSATVAEPLDAVTPTPTTTRPPLPTPTPSATAAADAAPAPPPPATGDAPAAPPPQPVGELPGIIAMNPGPFTGCGEYPTGQQAYLTFTWTAREGNTVDVYYAYTETDVQATSGFVLLGSGMATSGSVQIARTCPNGEGPMPLVTVKLVANNAYGSAAAYWWGI